MSRVTVAIVSWNTRELLRACLESFAAAARGGLAEVWVVDNASSDGSPGMVAEAFPWVRLIASDENLGFGVAVNRVAEQTTSEWIAPANADIALERGALETLISAGERHPEAAILAPRLIGAHGETQHSVHAFPGVGLAAALASGATSLSKKLGDRLCIDGSWDPDRAREVDWAHGAFLLCRREAFAGVGGFDPKQWMYAEDLDLAWRVRKAGGAIRYVPDARLRHAGAAATTQAFGDSKQERFMVATFAWMADRRGVIVTWAYAGISAFGAAARWAWYSLRALAQPGRFGPRRDASRSWLALHRRGLASRAALIGRR
ncbi:MAG: glycosyltransferase family 2 protein [Actinomycetota bacterium]|nr:glycosyltransferase family 2 protein [Actinomycetota bacterium]